MVFSSLVFLLFFLTALLLCYYCVPKRARWLRNCVLLCVKHFWRVMGVGLLQLAYIVLLALFAPWSLVLLPVSGVWYIVFLSQFLLYEQMDRAFHIES